MTATVAPARNLAEQAVELSVAAPRAAQSLAREALRTAATGDLGAVALAHRALGSAARELGQLGAAEGHLIRSISAAGQGGLPDLEGQARLKLAGVFSLAGKTSAALEETERAAAVLSGADRARVRVQQALILQRLDRPAEALEHYRVAIPALRRAGAALDEAQALANRAILHAYRGECGLADADLLRAEELQADVGDAFATAKIHHTRGFVAARRGDIPAALAWYDRTEEELRALGVPLATLLIDRCEALLSVRIVKEARAAAAAAAAELQQAGQAIDLAEARLLLAQAALLDGDPSAALKAAGTARRAFVAQRRRGWAALAAYVGLRAQWTVDPSGCDRAELRKVVADLERTGWVLAAADVRLLQARLALECGQIDRACRLLGATRSARRRGPADLRARAWHAQALFQLVSRNPSGAGRALQAGMQVLDDHSATLGATELRVHAAARSVDLATTGLAMAFESGTPLQVLTWAERWRAGALHHRAVRPPADPVTAEHLAQLRHVVNQLEAADAVGRDVEALLRRQTSLERAIRDRIRQVREHPASPTRRLPVSELREALGDRVLVEFVVFGSGLHAVTLRRGRARLLAVGDREEIVREVESLRFSLARLARADTPPNVRAAFESASAGAIDRLDDALFGPMRQELGDRPLVVAPTGPLHALPWSALPTCRERAVAVVPSAALWLQTRRGIGSGRRSPGEDPKVVLVAGPGLAQAEGEVAELHGIHRRSARLQGADARVEAVRASLDGADLGHVAAHGSFRYDNPLFSSLRLHDGDLTVYDLELLSRAPRLFVLSACQSGVSEAHAGDELMGLTAALLSLGATNLIASVIDVADHSTRRLMVELHRRLAAGDEPASALSGAQAAVGGAMGWTSIAGFVCMGA